MLQLNLTQSKIKLKHKMEQQTILPHNEKASAVWGSAGISYERISSSISDAIEHCIQRLDTKPGDKVLDIATGTGWAARRLAAKGASVTGVDIGRELIEAARLHPASCAFNIDFRVGDADALPFSDGEFDSVVSTFGVMFSSRPESAAAELARVCRKGGSVALTTWAPGSTIAGMFKVMKPYMSVPAVPPPSPFEWGSTERITELLGENFDLKFETGLSFCREESGKAVWNLFSECYGPAKMLAESLDDANKEKLKAEFIEFHENFITDMGISMPREYIVTIGVKK